MSKYRCNHCGKTVERDSTKRWITSMCDASGYKMTRLWRVNP
jgi:DNA-directed RNA polymerase subunit RPC12/RpoP